ncbi:TIGR02757 family protein [bacterium]|nr:TIGR02757 family protein [bacterium]
MNNHNKPANKSLRLLLNTLYEKYHQRKYVESDPLQFLYAYSNTADREIAGFICAGLAYGRVSQIILSLRSVFTKIGTSPFLFLSDTAENQIYALFHDFKHRFTTGAELAQLLCALKRIIMRYGSIQSGFLRHYTSSDETILPALCGLIGELDCRGNSLVAEPSKKSACKRLNLFMRWMVRHDNVDPGGWDSVSPDHLIVPLDTHMHKLSRALGFTSRTSADMSTALEITRAFRDFEPADPVKYDFALTRLGIRNEDEYRHILGTKNGLVTKHSVRQMVTVD